MPLPLRPLVAFGFVLTVTAISWPQAGAAAAAGNVERIKVHGRSLEGNLGGDAPARDVMVYLPPSYKTKVGQRYPVVYLLHGFTDDVDRWWGVVPHFVSVPLVMDAAIERGLSREMIVVMPNAYTRYQGSMYSNSANTGNWEDYLSTELIGHIDAHYRTIPNVRSRGLAGHSMGGYGAVRVGMKHPEVFSSIYAMSACCLTAGTAPDAERGRRAEHLRTPDEVQTLDFGMKVIFASAAAWSPNPKNPPFYLDLPTRDGQPRPDVLAKWAANAPLAMLDQYIQNIRKLQGLAFDVGTKDGLAAGSRALHDTLVRYDVPHTFETYDGDHVNRVAERLESKVFPFFSKHLQFVPAPAVAGP